MRIKTVLNHVSLFPPFKLPLLSSDFGCVHKILPVSLALRQLDWNYLSDPDL